MGGPDGSLGGRVGASVGATVGGCEKAQVAASEVMHMGLSSVISS
jgi:hypothetical protein